MDNGKQSVAEGAGSVKDPLALSPAESAIANLLATGASVSEIAKVRKRSEYTICNQVASIYRKLGVLNRAEFVAVWFAKHGAKSNNPDLLAKLTPVEWKVLMLAAKGYSNRKIAESERKSVSTIALTLTRSYVKLDARNRAQAIRTFLAGS